MISEKDKKEIKLVRRAMESLAKRLNSPKRVLLFGALQGAGAVIGATLLVLAVGFTLNLLGTFEPLSDTVKDFRQILREARTN